MFRQMISDRAYDKEVCRDAVEQIETQLTKLENLALNYSIIFNLGREEPLNPEASGYEIDQLLKPFSDLCDRL